MDVIVKRASTPFRIRLALIEANEECVIIPGGIKFEVDNFNSFLHIVWKAYAGISREGDGWYILKVPLMVYVGQYRIKIRPEVVDGVTGLRYGVVD